MSDITQQELSIMRAIAAHTTEMADSESGMADLVGGWHDAPVNAARHRERAAKYKRWSNLLWRIHNMHFGIAPEGE